MNDEKSDRESKILFEEREIDPKVSKAGTNAEPLTKDDKPRAGKRAKAKKVSSELLDPEELDVLRLRTGHLLAILVIIGVYGIYMVFMIFTTFFIEDAAESVRLSEFSLEIIRLLMPPLTFVLGFLFGARQHEPKSKAGE
ncbi:MAG: hypothetical protein FWD01_01885 [Defluviitaleaceae bacterium]|nr:hypothetical protein [Defluviitaleaceae bacterium]